MLGRVLTLVVGALAIGCEGSATGNASIHVSGGSAGADGATMTGGMGDAGGTDGAGRGAGGRMSGTGGSQAGGNAAGGMSSGARGGSGGGEPGCFSIPVVDHVRVYPRSGRGARMVGGKIVGSETSPNNGFVDLATIAEAPAEDEWTDITIEAPAAYRWIKYYGPQGSFGNVAELEFYAGDVRVPGLAYGTPSEDNATHAAADAFDGDVTTYYEGAVGNDQYVGLDTADGHVVATPVFSPVGGRFDDATNVTLSTATDGAVVHYTTDGGDPLEGDTYTKAIKVSTTTTIAAVATKDCMLNSATASARFTIGEVTTSTSQSSLHIGNSLTGPLVDALPSFVERQSKYTLDFHSCVSSGRNVSDFWDEPPGCDEIGVNPLPGMDPKAFLEDPTMLPPIDNLVVQPFPAQICTPYSEGPYKGDGAYASDFYQLAKSKNNPDVTLWVYHTWPEPMANWSEADCFAGGYEFGVPPWPMEGTTLPPPTDWETATRNHLLYDEAVRDEVDIFNGVDPSDPSTPGQHALIVPVGLALVYLKQDVEAGNVDGVAASGFFQRYFGMNGTDVHLSETGGNFAAMVFFAAFFRASPADIPASGAEGEAMQRAAYKAVSEYKWAGMQ